MGRAARPGAIGDVVVAFARAWEEWDAQAVAALFTPDGEYEEVRTADGAAAEWTWSRTHTGDGPGLPASGRACTLRGVTVLALADGRVRRAADDSDRATLGRQLGG